MKKTISLAVITMLALATFGQAAYAHTSSGNATVESNENINIPGASLGGVVKLNANVFNHSDNEWQRENRGQEKREIGENGGKGTTTEEENDNDATTSQNFRLNGQGRVITKGTVSSINASSSSFTIVNGDGKTITVNATGSTKFKSASTTSNTFANLAVGMSVKVKGFWNAMMNIITAIKVRIL